MSSSLNKVLLMGNLTRDPDLRSLPNGKCVCELGLAVNRRYQANNGHEVDEPCFVDVAVWGKSAENCKRFLEKGSPIFVEGRLAFEQWQGAGGEKKCRLRVIAEHVNFIVRSGQNAKLSDCASETEQ